MNFTPEHYFEAAQERLEQAFRVRDEIRQASALSHYLAGVSVECMLRAYRSRLDIEFDSRHDLYELARAARFDEIVPQRKTAEYNAALVEVAQRWFNNLRYCSDAALLQFLRKARLDRRVKGDILKESSRRIVNSAEIIVALGVAKWNSR